MRVKFEVDVNLTVKGENQSEVLNLLNKILKQNTKIMASQEQFESALNRIDTATTAIAQQLRDLRDQLENQGLPADVEAQVLQRLESAASQLEAVGQSVENPVPVDPTQPEA